MAGDTTAARGYEKGAVKSGMIRSILAYGKETVNVKMNGLKPDAKEVLQTLNCKTSLMEKRGTASLRVLMAGSDHGAAAVLFCTGCFFIPFVMLYRIVFP